MKRHAFDVAVLGFFLFGLCGCAGVIAKDKTMEAPGLLEPQSVLKFSDLPIPVGFKLLPEASYSFEGAGVRVAALKYQGKLNPDQVMNFFKEQMPLYNWRLLNVIEYGQRLLNFEREGESCIVNLTAKGNNLTLHIFLGPKANVPGKKGKQIVK